MDAQQFTEGIFHNVWEDTIWVGDVIMDEPYGC